MKLVTLNRTQSRSNSHRLGMGFESEWKGAQPGPSPTGPDLWLIPLGKASAPQGRVMEEGLASMFYLYYICIYVYTHICECIHTCVCRACGGQKKAADPSEPESCGTCKPADVGAGIQAPALTREQQVPWTTELSLQAWISVFNDSDDAKGSLDDWTPPIIVFCLLALFAEFLVDRCGALPGHEVHKLVVHSWALMISFITNALCFL